MFERKRFFCWYHYYSWTITSWAQSRPRASAFPLSQLRFASIFSLVAHFHLVSKKSSRHLDNLTVEPCQWVNMRITVIVITWACQCRRRHRWEWHRHRAHKLQVPQLRSRSQVLLKRMIFECTNHAKMFIFRPIRNQKAPTECTNPVQIASVLFEPGNESPCCRENYWTHVPNLRKYFWSHA